MALAAPSSNKRGADMRVGTEIANSWGWLLARAPRIARTLEQLPGAPQMMANVLAGLDFYCRRYGVDQHDPRAVSSIRMDVSYNEATDTILVRLDRG